MLELKFHCNECAPVGYVGGIPKLKAYHCPCQRTECCAVLCPRCGAWHHHPRQKKGTGLNVAPAPEHSVEPFEGNSLNGAAYFYSIEDLGAIPPQLRRSHPRDLNRSWWRRVERLARTNRMRIGQQNMRAFDVRLKIMRRQIRQSLGSWCDECGVYVCHCKKNLSCVFPVLLALLGGLMA